MWKKKTENKDMYLKEENGVPYFVFRNLEDTKLVRHGFSTRMGGVSKEHLSELNLSFTRGDDPENVRENFRRIGQAIGFAPESLVLSQQTHTTNIRLVTEEDRGRGYTKPLNYTDVDGLITNVPGLVLATFYADCVPLFFVDPVRRAVGLSHSGWKGTVNRMGAVTLERMKEAFGTEPSHLKAAVGPSICQDCYEVSEDVALVFKKEFRAYADDQLLYRKPNGRYQLNLWRANEIVLLEAGVKRKNLAMTDICTCCNEEQMFSHRASHGQRGNLGAFLELIPEEQKR